MNPILQEGSFPGVTIWGRKSSESADALKELPVLRYILFTVAKEFRINHLCAF